MIRTCVPAAILLIGCAKKREPAPTEMVDLVSFMFVNWEDDLAMQDALDNLGPWLDTNVETDEARDGFRLEPLGPDEVGVVDHPNAVLSDMLGAAGGALSAFPVDDHAAHMSRPDQLFSNPNNYKIYRRAVVEGSAAEFDAGTSLLRTVNDIETASWGVQIPYQLFKDYRWVETEAERAVIARAWTEMRSCNDGGGNCIEQSFSIDIFVGDGGSTQRLTASWSEVTTSLPLGDDALVAGLALGIQNVFYYTDEFLAGN